MYIVINIMYMLTVYSPTSTGQYYPNNTLYSLKFQQQQKYQNLDEKSWKSASRSRNWFTRLLFPKAHTKRFVTERFLTERFLHKTFPYVSYDK